MKRYSVELGGTFRDVVEIEAKSKEEAEEKAMDIFHEKTWDLVGTEVSEIQLYTND